MYTATQGVGRQPSNQNTNSLLTCIVMQSANIHNTHLPAVNRKVLARNKGTATKQRLYISIIVL